MVWSKTLEVTKIDYCRRPAGLSKREKLRNVQIREVMYVEPITSTIWSCAENSWTRLPKQILRWTLHGRRRRGSPGLSWKLGSDRAMRERELREDIWNNREQWRLGIARRRRMFWIRIDDDDGMYGLKWTASVMMRKILDCTVCKLFVLDGVDQPYSSVSKIGLRMA